MFRVFHNEPLGSFPIAICRRLRTTGATARSELFGFVLLLALQGAYQENSWLNGVSPIPFVIA